MATETCAGSRVAYYAPGDIRVMPASIPEPASGEVVIRVEACAICGTDVKTYINGNSRLAPEITMGHEFCGTVERIGSGVLAVTPGDRVTMATTIGCGTCLYCKQGKTNLCANVEAMGFHHDGAMAPYVNIPAKAVSNLVNVGDLPAEVAALSEPLSCCINDFSRVPVDSIKSLLIIGLGPLGVMHAILARQLSIENICGVARPGIRTKLATQFGFRSVSTPEEIDVHYKDLSGGYGFDMVIVTAPANEIQAKSPLYVKKGGYLSLFASLPLGDEFINVNSRIVHYNEICVYGVSDSTASHVKQAVAALEASTEQFRSIITHRLPISKFAEGVNKIQSREALKVVMFPD